VASLDEIEFSGGCGDGATIGNSTLPEDPRTLFAESLMQVGNPAGSRSRTIP
jgi:hypothetical protein